MGIVLVRGWLGEMEGFADGKREREHTTAGLDGITTFPNHGADWSAAHV